ncbi:helix-turn-helix domain-containing protein [Streptomyces sp. Da 82-17]|uniref:helix-turn-helix domain-containing protein n=1 Tax=Streptomyces sp. Da 82-17 TaxID=3377116 RepID=UPI0038D46E3D
MRSTGSGRRRPGTVMWDTTRPLRPSAVAGVAMAGFRDRNLAPSGHRMIPHPALTLALDFGERPPLLDDTAGHRHQGSLVAGLGFGAGRVRGERIACVQVRLSPLVAGAVLGAGPAELDGAVVRLADLWGERAAARLGERLAATDSWEARFALVEAELGRRSASGTRADPQVAWAWSRIRASGGAVRVDSLAAELGWSRRRLWTRFRAQIGLPPKQAARLIRFDAAAHRLASGHPPAEVAADTGYTDQSHLHREVASFTGTTPGAVAAEPFLAVDDVTWAGR